MGWWIGKPSICVMRNAPPGVPPLASLVPQVPAERSSATTITSTAGVVVRVTPCATEDGCAIWLRPMLRVLRSVASGRVTPIRTTQALLRSCSRAVLIVIFVIWRKFMQAEQAGRSGFPLRITETDSAGGASSSSAGVLTVSSAWQPPAALLHNEDPVLVW